jgi:hypothetical protein
LIEECEIKNEAHWVGGVHRYINDESNYDDRKAVMVVAGA